MHVPVFLGAGLDLLDKEVIGRSTTNTTYLPALASMRSFAQIIFESEHSVCFLHASPEK